MRNTLDHLKSLANSEKEAISKRNQAKTQNDEELLDLLGKTEVSFFEITSEN